MRCWKRCLRNGLLPLVCWVATPAAAQQPAAKTALDSQVVKEANVNQIQVISNGAAVPFATVINVRSGAATAADVNGVALMPSWNVGDTLRVQSLGFQELLVAPEPLPFQALNLVPSLVEIEEVVVQSNTSMVGSNLAMTSIRQLAAKVPAVSVETTGDLLQESGQVHLQQSQQGGISPVLRGFEANRVLLVVDGVRMNNAIYRSGHVQNAGTIDPFAVVRTDVVMGPSSVMYGSDALGGVVHFRTESPTTTHGSRPFTGRVLGQTTTVNGGWAGHAKLAWHGQRLATVTSVTRRHFGDLAMGTRRTHGDSLWGLVPFVVARVDGRDTLLVNDDPNVQASTGYDQTDVTHRMRVLLNRGFVDLNLQHSTTTNVPRFDALNDVSGDGVTPRWAEWSYGPQRRTLLASTYQRSLGGMHWTTTGSAQRIQESRIKRRFGSDARTTQVETVDVLGLTSSLQGWRGPWAWQAGLDGQWNAVDSDASEERLDTGEVGAAPTRYADGGSTMTSVAAFAATHRDVRNTTIRVGLRGSHAAVGASFADTTWVRLANPDVVQKGGAVTGSLSALTRWNSRWSTVSALSSGFRHPNVDDMGKVREKGGFVLMPNPNLRPEYLYTAEQALSWSMDPNRDVLKVDAAVFASLWNDAIVQANDTWEGDSLFWIDGDWARVQTNQNLDRAWVRGARFNVSARLWPKTTCRGVINWTRGSSLSGDPTPLAHIPPTFGRAEVRRSLAVGHLGCFVQFARAKRAEDYGPGSTDNLEEALPEGTPSWATLNLEGSLKVTDAWELRLAGVNLLDVHYKTFASGISAPGRGLRATASATF